MLILVLGNVGNSQSISQDRRDGCSRAFAWAAITISLLIRVFLRPPRHECGHTVPRFFHFNLPLELRNVKFRYGFIKIIPVKRTTKER